jgi:L-ascorbate metabolism protein UlaG (beta-lactamase superfamily)
MDDDRAMASDGRWYGRPHFDGKRFFNPSGANGQPFWRVPQMLLTPRRRWPAEVPVQARRPPSLEGADEVIVTFVGHATLLIQTPAGTVLTDPVYSRRASPLSFAGPRRVRAPGVAFEDLPPVSAVLVSHNHYDHCDLPTLRALDERFSPAFVTPLGNAPLLKSAGLRRVHELDWWQEVPLGSLAVRLTPAQHFSARGPLDRDRALWGGFLIADGRHRLFFAGDSGYSSHFREIRERCGPIPLALLPIGAYEPRWFMKDVHLDPAEAVQAHVDLQARLSVPMHYGTFQLTPEGIDEPLDGLRRALRAAGLPESCFRALDFGESLRLEAHVDVGSTA